MLHNHHRHKLNPNPNCTKKKKKKKKKERKNHCRHLDHEGTSDNFKNFFFFRIVIINLNYTKSNKNIISYIDNDKKNMQIHKTYNIFLRIFIFWNHCIMVSLSMLQSTFLSNFSSIKYFLSFLFLFERA